MSIRWGPLAIASLVGLAHSTAAPPRIERLLALAWLDAAVHYFDPAVATRASRWDSVFAANAELIANARDSRVYEKLITSLMRGLPSPVDLQNPGSPHRALVSYRCPNAMMPSSDGDGLRWRGAGSGDTYRVDMGEGVHVDVPIS